DANPCCYVSWSQSKDENEETATAELGAEEREKICVAAGPTVHPETGSSGGHHRTQSRPMNTWPGGHFAGRIPYGEIE
ncbi:MAG: hypothetical protein ABGZ35_26280, partial [Planctomycetaceae bacterium]